MRAAAPLGLVDMHVGVDEDVLLRGGFGDVVPDLEASRVFGPAGVLVEDLLGDARAVGVAQRVDHRHFERDVEALAFVDLVDHFGCVGPVSMCQRLGLPLEF